MKLNCPNIFLINLRNNLSIRPVVSTVHYASLSFHNNIPLGCGFSTTNSASTISACSWDHRAHKLQPHESSVGQIEENAAVPIGVLLFKAEPGA